MNKTQKRCFLASALGHASLLGALLIGSAFTKSRPTDPPIILHSVDPRIIEAALSRNAGNPNVTEVKLPPPAPPVTVPEPKVEPKAEPKVEPVPEPPPLKPEPRKPDPEPRREDPKQKTSEPAPEKVPIKKPEPVKPRIQVDTSRTIKRPSTVKNDADKIREAQERAEAKARAEAANKVASALRNSIAALNSSAAISDKIEVPGLGDEAFADYKSVVFTAFYRAWKTAGVEARDDDLAKVEVKIARDGTVLSARIIKPSGVGALDRSVRNAIDAVKSLPPFPPGAKDAQRTFILNFSLRSTRLNS